MNVPLVVAFTLIPARVNPLDEPSFECTPARNFVISSLLAEFWNASSDSCKISLYAPESNWEWKWRTASSESRAPACMPTLHCHVKYPNRSRTTIADHFHNI